MNRQPCGVYRPSIRCEMVGASAPCGANRRPDVDDPLARSTSARLTTERNHVLATSPAAFPAFPRSASQSRTSQCPRSVQGEKFTSCHWHLHGSIAPCVCVRKKRPDKASRLLLIFIPFPSPSSPAINWHHRALVLAIAAYSPIDWDFFFSQQLQFHPACVGASQSAPKFAEVHDQLRSLRVSSKAAHINQYQSTPTTRSVIVL